ncbi:MAG: polyprenyl synthetase family protein, partial [Bacteroidota bacterium]
MNVHEQRYNSLRRLVDNRLRSLVKHRRPKDVTDACRYVLSGGGKRVRSTLVLLSCEAVGGNIRDAVDASAAIELMHNF